MKRQTINIDNKVIFIRNVSIIDAGVGSIVWEAATMLAVLFFRN